jgi:hypothetical protein
MIDEINEYKINSYQMIVSEMTVDKIIRKDCFQNKSKCITEDHFTKHMNITKFR